MIFVLFDNNDIYSNKRLYFNMNLPDKTLYNYGLMTTIRLDIEKSIFGYFDFGNSVKVNENNYSMDEYNILNTDFKSSDNKYINEINDFLKNSEPSLKNMYTGLFKYKNLIFILAESFNPIAVNKEITPNLFKLFNEGFVFNNFYNPLYPVSTADGQYLSDISLFPSDASHSLEKVNTNYIPYSLGNVFSSMNYKTYSFHDYKYDYYSRDKYYKNMGYETYLASGNGLNEEGYKKDSKMAKYTLPLFIDDEKFLVYYLTVSGHIDYNSNNETATLNYDLVKDLKYSESVKYYLSTQIELDRMIKNIFDELIKKDKLDDTVIVLLPDHVPYGLTNSEMLELSKNNVNDEFDKYLSSMVIYNKSINKYKSTDNYCSNVDILPTLLNLFGVSYDSRLLIGRDILSSINGYAVFGNRNVIGKDFRYISIDNILLGENKNINGSDLKNEVYMKHRVSRLILENDYYRYLFKSNND